MNTIFNTWRIVTMTRNMSDGEAQDVVRKNTEKEAMDTFYGKCNSFGTNPQTKACAVFVFAPNGIIHRYELIDNSKYITEETAE